MNQREEVITRIRAQLQEIRSRVGEDAYRMHARMVAQQFKAQGGEVSDIAREVFGDAGFDYDALTAGPSGTPPPMNSSILLSELRKLVPGIRTQAQFDIFMAGFQALTLGMQAAFHGDRSQVETSKTALTSTLDLALQATDLAQKLEDVGEAANGEEADRHKKEPKEFSEIATQEALLQELSSIATVASLREWYQENRVRFEQLQTPTMRNSFFDAVRARHSELSGTP